MKKKKILVVDDQIDFIDQMKLILEQTGQYTVRVESEGKKAFSTTKEFQPDFIFLDINMPDMEGPEVRSMIKSDESVKDIPVVYLTALVTQDELNSWDGKIGGRSYLAKPVNKKQLIECIEGHIT